MSEPNLIYTISLTLTLITHLDLLSAGTLNIEHRKLYDDIKSGRGLYSEKDMVTVLNATNFRRTVFGTESAWIIEFYNSWCGFCHRFAPVWRSLAADINAWQDVLTIAAVDCSNDDNNPLCREYEIMYYPMLKFFPAHSKLGSLGQEVKKGKNIQEIRQSLVALLVKEQIEGRGLSWPNIMPYRSSDVKNLWKNVPTDIKYTFLIIDDADSTVGIEVILDLHSINVIQIRRVLSENEALLRLLGVSITPNLVLLEREMSPVTLKISDNTRAAFRKAIKTYLSSKDISVPEEQNIDDPGEWTNVQAPDLVGMMLAAEEEKKSKNIKSLGDVVFQVDLEKAVMYSLKHEVASHKLLTGDSLKSLQNYITVLTKYFHTDSRGEKFLKQLRDKVFEVVEIRGETLLKYINELEADSENSFSVSQNQNYIGCMGSKPEYRGFPCGMWMLFHTLTVNSVIEAGDARHFDNFEVLNSMVGYITHFFGCQDCSKHFQEMVAESMDFQVLKPEDSILWLWKSHNKVNKRLAGDMTEDPLYPKYQFPSKDACSTCRNSKDDWNEAEVLKYLKKMYNKQNISYMGINVKPAAGWGGDKQNNRLTENKQSIDNAKFVDISKEKQDGKQLGWNFNNFDISICVILYMLSSILLLVICVKFVMKRKYRKKSYIHDLFGKV